MNNVELRTENIALPEKDQLLVSCGRVLDKLAASAPSDSIMNMAVDFDGEDFIIDVELVSGEMQFSVVADAKSPYMALEKAVKEVSDRIKKWSATRQVETMPATIH
ncbi:hypothetical protein B9G69_005480 [Bdellovibrio sp. SKB1291214]|uniref:hypothetical protein n=1 Tax=Bdellovibrio sp. SKB1291214 TaxID=1732569 RepID=UPI000B51C57E|nr:hypothetical protein [Bdellovibrio sp. SKB1291214]UYL10026.1 hypothetical protein B9G69_005480 [Bdellovibrio sp. SKB1291214]